MALPWKVRAAVGLMHWLQVARLAPGVDRAARMPMAKRLAMGPGKGMLGIVADVPTRDVTVPTRDGSAVRVRLYEPPGATAPVLYAHGGGFVVGGLRSCDHICRRLAAEAGVVVASVEYRLAPEHPYPVPLDDCEDALAWLLEQDLDGSRLVVAGDSAGGNLAAALALRLRDRGTPPAGQLLVYPVVDLTVSGAGLLAYKGVGLSPEECVKVAALYLAGADPRQPYASPLLAPDLTGSAPALVLTVHHDALHAEGVAFAERLREAGVPVTLLDLPDHAHGSLSLPALYPDIDQVYERILAFLRDPLAAGRS